MLYLWASVRNKIYGTTASFSKEVIVNNLTRRIAVLLIVGILVLGAVITVEYIRANSVKRYPRIQFGETTVGKFTFVQRAALPDTPSSFYVYRVKPMESMNAEFLKLVEALPIMPSPEDERKLRNLKKMHEPSLKKQHPLMEDIGDWQIILYLGGQYSIRNLAVCNSLSGRDAKAPSPEEARKFADSFLLRTKLLPAGASFEKVYDSDISEWGFGDKVVHSRGVVYQCNLGELSTAGGFTVVVGPGGEIASISNGTRHTIPDEKVPILSPLEAMEKLQSNEGHVEGSPSWSAISYVDSISISYWRAPLAMDISYIMPVYVFEGDAVAKGKPTEHWKAYVEAVRPEFLEPKPAKGE